MFVTETPPTELKFAVLYSCYQLTLSNSNHENKILQLDCSRPKLGRPKFKSWGNSST